MKKFFSYSLIALPVLSMAFTRWVKPVLPQKPTPVIRSVPSAFSGEALDPVQPRADIIAHSPEVEAMTKYGVLPVTLYTGLPQINVPLFELKPPSLSIPFSLSYNYNGFKPSE